MGRRGRWAGACAVGIAAAMAVSVAGAQEPAHVDRPSKPRPRPDPTGVGTLGVPSPSMAPAIPAGASVQVDYDAFEAAQPVLGDLVVFWPPRSVERSGRCGVPTSRRAMCPRPVRRLASIKFLARVVGVPADRLRMRDGLIVRNGDAVEESFADVSDCLSGCDFPRAITVPAGHFFVLGDNRGQSWDSRFWGPVPARALLGRVTGCITEAGEPCAVEARHVGRASAASATQSVPHGLSITKRQVPSA